MSDAPVEFVTVDQLRDLLQQAGYRVEPFTMPDGAPALRSATGGLPFDVRFGTRLPGDEPRYGDFTLLAGLRVEGELPPGTTDRWNNARRFGRLRLMPDVLILDMDVSMFGGVTLAHVRAQIEIWDRIVQDLVPSLRDGMGAPASRNGATQDAAGKQPAAVIAAAPVNG